MEEPMGLFKNQAKRFRWNPVDTPTESNNQPEDQMGIPFELAECLTKIARSSYMQDLSQIRQIQDTSEPIYALATAHAEPNYFWIQYSLKSETNKVDEMYANIIKTINCSRHKNRTTNRFVFNEVSVGLGCNAQYRDGNWYRALVTQIIGGDYFKVLYPDFGNIETVSLEELTRTGQSHYSAPIQALCSCLYNIRPKHQDLWPEIGSRLRQFFDNHSRSNQDLVVLVRRVRHDHIVDCDIFLNNKTNAITSDNLYRKHIAQDIVDEGLASFIDPRAAHSIKDECIIVKKESTRLFPSFSCKPMTDVPGMNIKQEIKQERLDRY